MSQAKTVLSSESPLSRVVMPWQPPLRPPSLPSRPPAKASTADLAALSPADTLADLIAYIDSRTDWRDATRSGLKTAVRQLAWSLSLIQARDSGQPLNSDRKKLDLARIPFDIPAINHALKGMSYRLAGFNSDKSYRNAKTGLRRVGRALRKVAPDRPLELPPDSPYAPFLDQASRFEKEAARCFASKLYHAGLWPAQVTDADVVEHGTFLLTRTISGNIDGTSRRLVRLWNTTARHHPDWPQAPLTLPGGGPKPISPPFTAYSVAVQQEINMVRGWLDGSVVPGWEGSDRPGPFHRQRDRKPLRPDTIKYRLAYVRLILGVYVELGHDPKSMTSLRALLVPETMQAILQALWDRGQLRLQAIPQAERDYNESGNTGQTSAAGEVLVMLATHCFPQPPDVLKALQGLAKKVRKPPPSEMSRKNSKRLDQFMDPLKLGLLLNLPHTMMREAMAMRGHRPAEAARLARTAIIFAIECRIPLRIKNLQSCRLGL